MKSTVLLAGVIVVVTGLLFLGKSVNTHNKQAAPDFELKVVQSNKSVKLSDLKGKAVLLNFWATWCEPCKVEMPWLVDFQKKYGSQGLQIVGVAMDDTEDSDIAKFTQKMGVNYPILKGTEKVADQYGGINGLPELFFIDRSGNIVEHDLGLRGADVIENGIKKILGDSEPVKSASAK